MTASWLHIIRFKVLWLHARNIHCVDGLLLKRAGNRFIHENVTVLLRIMIRSLKCILK